ncbi:MAG: 50S ribosomal protein L3 [bacterium]
MQKLIGIKKGMTKMYDGDNMVPVTVVELPKNVVFTTNKGEKGNLVRIGILKKKRMNKPEEGLYKKVGFAPKKAWDVWMEEEIELGTEFGAETLSVGDLLMITGTGKGKGFAGVVKRYKFAGGPKTHGQSDRLRAGGSIGAGTDPGRVIPGKKMPGRMGGKTITTIKRKVMEVGSDYVVVSGSLPGSNGSYLKIEVTKKNES